VVVDREVAVAIGIRARRGNVSGIEDVGVDKVQLVKSVCRTMQTKERNLTSCLMPSYHSG